MKWLKYLLSIFVLIIFIAGELHGDQHDHDKHAELHKKVELSRRKRNEII